MGVGYTVLERGNWDDARADPVGDVLGMKEAIEREAKHRRHLPADYWEIFASDPLMRRIYDMKNRAGLRAGDPVFWADGGDKWTGYVTGVRGDGTATVQLTRERPKDRFYVFNEGLNRQLAKALMIPPELIWKKPRYLMCSKCGCHNVLDDKSVFRYFPCQGCGEQITWWLGNETEKEGAEMFEVRPGWWMKKMGWTKESVAGYPTDLEPLYEALSAAVKNTFPVNSVPGELEKHLRVLEIQIRTLKDQIVLVLDAIEAEATPVTMWEAKNRLLGAGRGDGMKAAKAEPLARPPRPDMTAEPAKPRFD